MYNLEIERKFLVKDQSFIDQAIEIYMVRQGFLMLGEHRSLRIRTDRIIKGKTPGKVTSTLCFKVSSDAMTRSEHEFEVERDEAIKLFEFCQTGIIEKTRYWVQAPEFIIVKDIKKHLMWEIDIFHGENEGLVVAEIEVPWKDFTITMPPWIGAEVTEDPRYLNTYISKIPYNQWEGKQDA